MKLPRRKRSSATGRQKPMTNAAAGMQMDMDNVEQFRIPADNTFQSGTFDGVWSIRADFNANRTALQKFIYG